MKLCAVLPSCRQEEMAHGSTLSDHSECVIELRHCDFIQGAAADHRPRNHLCRNRRGALHRMNYDTPPLRGSCWGFLRTLGRSQAASITCGDQGFLGKPRYSYGFGRENRLCRYGKQRTLPTSAQPRRRRRDARNPLLNRCSGCLLPVAESEITRCNSRRLWLIFLERARKLSHDHSRRIQSALLLAISTKSAKLSCLSTIGAACRAIVRKYWTDSTGSPMLDAGSAVYRARRCRRPPTEATHGRSTPHRTQPPQHRRA